MKAQSEQTISTGYRPRPLQADIHINRKRFSVLAIHRRFGKSVCAISECIDQALTCPLHNPRVAYIAPFYKQAKSIAWDYLKDFTANIPKSKAYESELKVDIPMGEQGTARIQLFGADHPDSLRGLYFDFVVFDEFGLQPISIWEEVVRPALADRKGAAMFLGTPNGKNHFYEMYRKAVQEMNNNNEEWFAATYRADETNVVDAKELESMKENMPDSKYRQEMLCDWSAAVQGAFYADDLNRVRNDGRITNVPYCRSLPVYAAFDLGIDDQTAIWFVQFLRNEIRLIDYVEFSDKGLLDILAEIQHQMRVSQQEKARAQQKAAREHEASLRQPVQAHKAAERAAAQAKRASEADRKRMEREAKAAHVAAKQAEVEPGGNCVTNRRHTRHQHHLPQTGRKRPGDMGRPRTVRPILESRRE